MISTIVMFQAQNRETKNTTWKVAASFKIIMTTSVTRSCFATQHHTCNTKTTARKTKTKTDFLVLDRSCHKTDGLSPHHWLYTGACIVLLYTPSVSAYVGLRPVIVRFQASSTQWHYSTGHIGDESVVKVRGRGGGSAPCSHLSPTCNSMSPPDWIYKVLFYA